MQSSYRSFLSEVILVTGKDKDAESVGLNQAELLSVVLSQELNNKDKVI